MKFSEREIERIIKRNIKSALALKGCEEAQADIEAKETQKRFEDEHLCIRQNMLNTNLKKHIEIFNKYKEAEKTARIAYMKLTNEYMEVANKRFDILDICIDRLKIENIILVMLLAFIIGYLFIR